MWMIVTVYLLIGLSFGGWFFIRGHAAVDPTAATAHWLTRILWMPGACLLWPILLRRVLRTQASPASEEAQ